MLSRYWRWAVRLYCETQFGSARIVGGDIRSGQGPFEEQMQARAHLGRPQLAQYPSRAQVERYVRTVVLNPTRSTPRFEEPEVSFKALAVARDVKRGLAGVRRPEAVLLAYGTDCVRGRDIFGPWGNLAHLSAAAAEAFTAARARSHRRQRELGEWLDDLALRARHGDDDAELVAKAVARSCDRLLDQVSGEFMRGVDARRAA